MKVLIGRKTNIEATVGDTQPGETFVGARTGRLFIRNDNGTFTHLETGATTQITPSVSRNAVYIVQTMVVRDGIE